MNRQSFLRNIFGAAVAIMIAPVVKLLPIAQEQVFASGLTTNLFNDLNFLIPEYIPKLIEKYSSENYNAVLSSILTNINE